jgi:hypothetical protein
VLAAPFALCCHTAPQEETVLPEVNLLLGAHGGALSAVASYLEVGVIRRKRAASLMFALNLSISFAAYVVFFLAALLL